MDTVKLKVKTNVMIGFWCLTLSKVSDCGSIYVSDL